MKEYERLTDKKHRYKKCASCSYGNCQYCDDYNDYNNECINRLCELEDKIENGRLVDCIWFISWLSEAVCCGQVIGYEEDSGFVILTNASMISADKIWTNYEDAQKELLKRKIKQLNKKEYQEFKAEAEAKLKELKGEV